MPIGSGIEPLVLDYKTQRTYSTMESTNDDSSGETHDGYVGVSTSKPFPL